MAREQVSRRARKESFDPCGGGTEFFLTRLCLAQGKRAAAVAGREALEEALRVVESNVTAAAACRVRAVLALAVCNVCNVIAAPLRRWRRARAVLALAARAQYYKRAVNRKDTLHSVTRCARVGGTRPIL